MEKYGEIPYELTFIIFLLLVSTNKARYDLPTYNSCCLFVFRIKRFEKHIRGLLVFKADTPIEYWVKV